MKTNKKKPKPSIDDLLDPEPTEPQVFQGIFKGVQRRCALVYKRDNYNVWTIMFSENGGDRVTHKWGIDTFEANMRPAPVPIGMKCKVYPLERALKIYLQEGAVYGEGAYRILLNMSKGRDPEAENTIDDILDTAPSPHKPRTLRGKRTYTEKVERKKKRAAKFAGMTPVQLKAWRDSRNAYRKLRRMQKKRSAK